MSLSLLLLIALISSSIDCAYDCKSLVTFNQKYGQFFDGDNIIDSLSFFALSGEGSFGKIYVVPWKDPKRPAMKSVAIKKCSSSANNEALNEIERLAEFRTKRIRNVVAFIDCFYVNKNEYEDEKDPDNQKIYIVMEGLYGSFDAGAIVNELDDEADQQEAREESSSSGKFEALLESIAERGLIKNKLYKKFRESGLEVRLEVYRQIAVGLSGLHDELKLVHNDVKPANILSADKNLSLIKLIDFGFTVSEDHPVIFASHAYMDYEKQLTNEKYWGKGLGFDLGISEVLKDNWKADIWAFAYTIYQLENNQLPSSFDTELTTHIHSRLLTEKINESNSMRDSKWMEERGLNICSKGKNPVCFESLMHKMTEVAREDRCIKAAAIAAGFQTLIRDLRGTPEKKGFCGTFKKIVQNVKEAFKADSSRFTELDVPFVFI